MDDNTVKYMVDTLSAEVDALKQENEDLSKNNEVLIRDKEALSKDKEVLSKDKEVLSKDNEISVVKFLRIVDFQLFQAEPCFAVMHINHLFRREINIGKKLFVDFSHR